MLSIAPTLRQNTEPPMTDLGSRSLSALLWGAGGSVIRIALQFGTQVVLARILGPEQYGLFAIGVIVVGFSNYFADVGIAYGLIQKENVGDQDIRFVLTWQILIGSAVSLTLVAASQHIADFFGESRAGQIVGALAIICLLNAIAAPSLSLLKRKLDFRSIQIAHILSYIAGNVFVGIPMALHGSQVWALVCAWLVQATTNLLLVYNATRHPGRPLLWFSGGQRILSYGMVVLITNLINWTINNVDRVFVGRAFGSRDIGLYTTAYNTLYSPTTTVLGVMQPVFFSASARISNDKPRTAAAYRTLIASIALFVLPVFSGVSAISETFVLALYGPAWQPAATLFQPLALAMPLVLVWGLTTPLLWTGGKPEYEFLTQLPIAIVWAVVAWLISTISVGAVAWAVFGLFLTRCVVVVVTAITALDLDVAALWRAARGGVVLSAGCTLAIITVDLSMRWLSDAAVVWLIADIVGAMISGIAMLYWVPGIVSVELGDRLARTTAQLPIPLAMGVSAILNRQRGKRGD
jgi:lipopolysaccharide exporter